ncbi:hypothetical protein [Saccharopolyspora sp. NPDC049426]|uniref:hypothetical protein n=1 Tax=Saccharopolyspora sp. NPDC049426 TaxID=3155652 RepID=UPI00343086F2
MKTTHELRALARQALAGARAGEIGMRDHARNLLDEARRRELTELSQTVGRRNVTTATYRAFLYQQLQNRTPAGSPQWTTSPKGIAEAGMSI